MAKCTFQFAAPISNALGCFRNIKLQAPFKIEKWDYDKLADLVNEIDGPHPWAPDPRIDEFKCIDRDTDTCFVVTGRMKLDHDEQDTKSFLRLHKQLDAQSAFLSKQIELIRLYLSAPICLATEYWYEQFSSGETVMHSATRPLDVHEEPTYVSQAEARSLNEFLLVHSAKKHAGYISIALDHWNHSYGPLPKHLQLLSLITALEVLLNPSQTEIKHRVTRHTSILVGRTVDQSQRLYKSLSEVYDARSKVVHAGQVKACDTIDYYSLRRWASTAIKLAMELNISKDDLCRDLNQLGFGDGPEYLFKHGVGR